MKSLIDYPADLPLSLLNMIPDPVLVKNENLEYIWANKSFLDLFSISLEALIGRQDAELFPERQAAQCNSGDLRVLSTGEVDEAIETILEEGSEPKETITRKSRYSLSDGSSLLIGVMHDITHVSKTNRQLELLTEQLELKNKELDALANTDVLTSCLNRRAFLGRAHELLSGNQVGLLIADIDYFKGINDKYGHAAGDASLQHFVQVAKKQIRHRDELARVGGEEFAFLLPEASKNDVVRIGERLRLSISSTPLHFESQVINLTVSIGGALACTSDFSVEDLVKQADKQLYLAKENGRNQLRF